MAMAPERTGSSGQAASRAAAGGVAKDRPVRRKKRRWLRVLIVVAGALGLLVWASPYILSAGIAAPVVIGLINDQIRGRAELEGISLSWLGPIKLTGLSVADPDGREVLRVDRISMDRGLLGAILSGQNFSQVNLSAPRAVLYLDERGETSLARAFQARRPRAEPARPPEPKGRILLEAGALRVVRPDGRSFEITRIDGQFDLNTLDDVSGVLLLALAGGGQVHNTFSIRGLAAEGKISAAKATGTISSSTPGRLEIGPVGAFALNQDRMGGTAGWDVQLRFEPGKFGGTLAVDVRALQAAGAGPAGIRLIDLGLTGRLDITGEALAGTMTLTGQIGQVQTEFSYRPSEDGRRDRIDLGGIVSAALLGESIWLPEFKLSVDGKLDLAALARAVPALLRLRPGVEIATGQVGFEEVKISGGKDPVAQGKVQLTGLTARRGERAIRWDPVAVDFDVRGRSDQGVKVEKGTFTSDFAGFSATGPLTRLAGTFQADFTRLHQQLAELIDLGSFEIAGKAGGTFGLTRSGDRVDTRLTATADGLRYVAGQRKLNISRAALVHEGYLSVAPGELRSLVVNKGQVQIDGVGDLSGAGRYEFADGTFKADVDLKGLDLARLQDLLGWGADAAKFALAGKVAGKVSLTRDKADRIDLSLNATADSLEYAAGGKRLRIGRAVIGQNGHLNVAGGSVTRLVVTKASADADGAFVLSGSGWLDRPGNTFGADVKLQRGDLAYAGRLASAWGIEGLSDYAGILALTVRAERSSPGGPIVSNGSGEVTDLRAGGDPLGDKQTTFNWSDVRLDPGRKLLSAAAGGLESTLASLRVEDLRCRLGDDISVDARIERLRADLGPCLAAARPLAKWDKAPAFTGRLEWSGTARTAGGTTTFLGTGKIAALGYRTGKAAVDLGQVTVEQEAEVDWRGEAVALRKFQIDSKPLSVRLTGQIRQIATARDLDLTGHYSASWDRLMPLVHAFVPGTVDILALVGKTASEFRIVGAANRPEVRPVFHGVDAGLDVGWASGRAYGLNLGTALFSPALHNGQANLPVTAIRAGKGKVRLGGLIDLQPTQPVLRIPGKVRVLENVEVTAELGRHLLSRINPVFAELDLGRAEGTISLLVEGIELPLGKQLRHEGSGRGHLDLTAMKVVPRGLLKALLGLGGLAGDQAQPVKVSGVDFDIRNGRVNYGNFTMTFADRLELRFHGSVGFDDSLDMAVSVPLRTALLRRVGVPGPIAEYARVLEGAVVDIPIVGTRLKPRLDLSKLDISPLIDRARLLLIQRGVGEIVRPREPAPPPTRPATKPAPKTPEGQLIDFILKRIEDRINPPKRN